MEHYRCPGFIPFPPAREASWNFSLSIFTPPSFYSSIFIVCLAVLITFSAYILDTSTNGDANAAQMLPRYFAVSIYGSSVSNIGQSEL
jgi:hypothetical protein